MLKAQRAYGRLSADASHRPWLLRIAHNTFLDERRRQVRLVALPPEHEARLPAPGHDLAAALDARDLLAEVQVPTAARANVYQALRKLREQFGDRL